MKKRMLLAKGLNFAITPDKIPHNDYIFAMELVGSEIMSEANK